MFHYFAIGFMSFLGVGVIGLLVATIIDQRKDKNVDPLTVDKHLPIGRTEFEAWAKDIIAKAAVPGLTEESAKFTLCSMLLHLPSTQSMKMDGFFVHAMRKAAVNETAYQILREIENNRSAKKAAEAIAPVLNLVPPTNEKGSAN
jgi:hypothetical protein